MEFTLWLHHFLFLFGTFSALFTSKIIIYSTWLAYEHEQEKGRIAQRSELLLRMHRLAFHARDQVDKIVLKCDASALLLITSNDVSHIPYSAIFSPIDGVYTLRSLFFNLNFLPMTSRMRHTRASWWFARYLPEHRPAFRSAVHLFFSLWETCGCGCSCRDRVCPLTTHFKKIKSCAGKQTD